MLAQVAGQVLHALAKIKVNGDLGMIDIET
jgi:hypothetical protein